MAFGRLEEIADVPDLLPEGIDGPDGHVPWEAVIDAAYDVRDRLAALGLQSFVKTSGGKGLHVVAPIQPEAAWDEVKTFAKTIAGTMVKERADHYVATMVKRARGARIFVDYLRNDRGATAAAPYSTRALPRASVSIPLNWEELSPGLRSDHFTVGNVLHRLLSLKQDPWQGFFKIRQRLRDWLGPNFAPAMFSNERGTREVLRRAMERLFDKKLIRDEPVGPPSKNAKRIVAT